MQPAALLHEALDQLLALAEQQGLPAKEYLGAGTDPALVRNELDELGLMPTQELVDFLSWRKVIHPRGSAPLFWETEYWSFETMLQTYRDNRMLVSSDGALDGLLRWPGPATWFPVLMTDPSEIVAVESGERDNGSVWFAFTQDTPFKMYSSLLEAVMAAQRAIRSGAWWFDVTEGRIRANRHWMPWPGDADPWAEPRHR
jgi:hypothetical protein